MSQDMLGVSVHDAQGVVTDLLEKLGGRNGQEWLKAFRRFLRKEDPWPNEVARGSSYAVTVDYDLSLAGMIRKGAYDYANPDITSKHFPINGEGAQTLTIELVHFGVALTSEQVLEEFARRGLRPATLPELLALGAQYSDLQRQFLIVALGSVWRDRNGSRRVPYLSTGDRKRHLAGLDLSWFVDRRWDRAYRFAAVRMKS